MVSIPSPIKKTWNFLVMGNFWKAQEDYHKQLTDRDKHFKEEVEDFKVIVDAAGNITQKGILTTIDAKLTEQIPVIALPAPAPGMPAPPPTAVIFGPHHIKAGIVNAKDGTNAAIDTIKKYYEHTLPGDKRDILKERWNYTKSTGWVGMRVALYASLALQFLPLSPWKPYSWAWNKIGEMHLIDKLTQKDDHVIKYKSNEQHQIQVRLKDGKAWFSLDEAPVGDYAEVRIALPYQGAGGNEASNKDTRYELTEGNGEDKRSLAEKVTKQFDHAQTKLRNGGELPKGKAYLAPEQVQAWFNDLANNDKDGSNITPQDYEDAKKTPPTTIAPTRATSTGTVAASTPADPLTSRATTGRVQVGVFNDIAYFAVTNGGRKMLYDEAGQVSTIPFEDDQTAADFLSLLELRQASALETRPGRYLKAADIGGIAKRTENPVRFPDDVGYISSLEVRSMKQRAKTDPDRHLPLD